jgi:hypothetical protein
MPLPSEPEPYEIKKQGRFDASLLQAVSDADVAAEVERGIRFAVRYFPEAGIDTGRSTPAPVYAWPIMKTHRHPPLVVYYCVVPPRTVLLLSVRATEEED